MELVTLPIDGIRINGGTQPRVETNETAVAEYAEVIRFGGELPPVVVFDDGAECWLADGFHRFHAHVNAGAMEIVCDVRLGTKRDAILFSVGANASHGLRRSNDDKRKAVMTLLKDSEWSTWSDNAIAKACSVDHKTVAAHRQAILGNSQDAVLITRNVERNGRSYTQNTANIGKAKPAFEVAEQPVAVPAEKPDAKLQAAAEKSPETVEASSGELAALHEQLDELRASMKETLADNEMMGRAFDADDRVKAAMDEAKRQKAIAENAERTLAAKNGEYIERARAVTHWQSRALKAEKELAKLKAAA